MGRKIGDCEFTRLVICNKSTFFSFFFSRFVNVSRYFKKIEDKRNSTLTIFLIYIRVFLHSRFVREMKIFFSSEYLLSILTREDFPFPFSFSSWIFIHCDWKSTKGSRRWRTSRRRRSMIDARSLVDLSFFIVRSNNDTSITHSWTQLGEEWRSCALVLLFIFSRCRRMVE